MNKWIEYLKYNEYWVVASLLMVVKLCLHFFTNTNYELHRDEMFYFNMADHLDGGYASVPPVIGLFAFLTKAIFGYSVFGIRFFPAIMGAASMFIIAKIIQKLGGGILALVIGLSAYLLSAGFLLIDMLFTPNVIEHFCWLLITYYLFRMTNEDNPKHWIWIGLLVGCSFLTKYSVLFLVTGFVISLFFSPYRKLLFSRYLLYAIIISLVIISPNIYWQYTHNWPVMYHMKELNSSQLVKMNYKHFLIDVFSLNHLLSLVWLIGLFFLIIVKTEKKNQYLGIGSLTGIVLFILLNGKGYYIMGFMPFLSAYGAYVIAKHFIVKYKLMRIGIITVSLIFSVMAMPYAVPLLSFDHLSSYAERTQKWIVYPFYRWEDGKVHPISQVYADMTGWQELSSYAAKAYRQLSEQEQKSCTIYAERSYGLAGAIHFYGKKYGLPEPVTFSDSYVIWAPDEIPEGPIIYIYYEMGEMVNLYHSIKEIGCINNPYSREKGLKVFLCTQPKTDVSMVFAKVSSEAKLIYRK